MHAFILQDYTTIRAASGVQTITQGEAGWLDLTPYQDLVFWLDVREQSGTTAPTIQFQTSPTKDESLFQGMLASAVSLSAGTVSANKALMAGATTPVARYVRWQLAGPATGGWDATFRVLVAANSPGM